MNPAPDDLQALETAHRNLMLAADTVAGEAARVDLVRLRLSQPDPPPPPPDPALPAVGIGGSGAFGALPRAQRQALLATAAAAGITHFRFDVQWNGTEYAKGKYGFKAVIEKVQDITAAGLTPMCLVGWPPPFYRRNATDPNSAPKDDALTRAAWEAWCRALFSTLYQYGVRRYEIWNEPNFMFMQPVSPGLWADLVLNAYSTARDISAHIRIISGGVCPAVDAAPRSMSASRFYDAVLQFEPDFFRYVNEVGIHPYAGNHTSLLQGKFWREQVTYLSSIIPAEVPFCGTEHGWLSGPNPESERSDLYVDSIRTWPEAAPVYLFSLFDFAEPYGLLLKDGTPKLTYLALKDLLT